MNWQALQYGRATPGWYWLIAAAYFLFLFPSPEYPVYNADDSSFFVTLARNLVEHGRYTADTFPAADYGWHATWPPLFPALLATVIAVFGVSWWALKLLMVTLGLLNLRVLSRLLPDANGPWAVALTALSPAYFLYAHHTMAEVPYMLLVALAMAIIGKVESAQAAFLAGCIAAAAFFTRGYAITLLPAGVVFLFLAASRRRTGLVRALIFAIPLVAAIFAWKSYTDWIVAHHAVDSLTARFGTGTELLEQAWRSPKEYLQRLYWHDLPFVAHLMLPAWPIRDVVGNPVAAATGILLLGGAFLGWVAAIYERRGIVEIWLPIAITLLLIPKSTAARYWLPILPFLFFYFLGGLAWVAAWLPALAKARGVGIGILFLAATVGLVRHLASPDDLRYVNSFWQDYRHIAVWAREGLAPNAIVVAASTHKFYATGLKRTFPAETLQAGAPWPAVLAQEPQVHMLCARDARLSLAGLAWHCDTLTRAGRLVKLRENGSLILYRIVEEKKNMSQVDRIPGADATDATDALETGIPQLLSPRVFAERQQTQIPNRRAHDI